MALFSKNQDGDSLKAKWRRPPSLLFTKWHSL